MDNTLDGSDRSFELFNWRYDSQAPLHPCLTKHRSLTLYIYIYIYSPRTFISKMLFCCAIKEYQAILRKSADLVLNIESTSNMITSLALN